MKDFLNPKSMMTPGAAGAIMMFLANGLCSQFPELAFRYVALALSVALASAILKTAAMKVPEKVFYWLMNSLVIFVVGIGASNVGVNLQGSAGAKAMSAEMLTIATPSRSPASVATEAEQGPSPPSPAPAPGAPSDTQNYTALGSEVERLQDASRKLLAENRQLRAEKLRAEAFAQAPVPDQGFFNRW